MVAETDREDVQNMLLDPDLLVATRQNALLEEARRDRIADQLPRSHSGMRHGLAAACLRLADWIDDAGEHFGEGGYVRQPDSGPPDWSARSARVGSRREHLPAPYRPS